jgi:hypothetical protein
MKNVKHALFPLLCINEIHMDFYAAQKADGRESIIEIGLYDWLLLYEPLF